jgi:ABC-2 type transport system permease protein
MNLRHIWTIFRKDLRDALRDSRVLLAILLPLGLGLLYNVMFQDTTTTPTATIAYDAANATTLPEHLKTALGPSVRVTIVHASSEVDARQRLARKQADIALLIPSDFDAALRRGETPTVRVLRSTSTNAGGAIVLSALDGVLRQLAGQHPPVVVQVESIPTDQIGIQSIFEQIGLRPYFALASIMMMVGMITMLALPIVLGEEREKKTLDALVLVASHPEVIAAKALLGVVYILVAIPLLLALTRVMPADVVTFVAAIGLLSVTLIGFGLLLGGLFTANQMNTWGSLLLIPIIVPPFFLGMPLPGALATLFALLPTTQAMQLILNSMGPHQFFPQVWLSYLVITAWGIVAYGALWWRLSRRED